MCLAAPRGASGDRGVIGGEGVPTEEGVSGGLKINNQDYLHNRSLAYGFGSM